MKADRHKIPCKKCGRVTTLELKPGEYEAWRSGGIIQQCMPDLRPHERELFISGICEHCWKLAVPRKGNKGNDDPREI